MVSDLYKIDNIFTKDQRERLIEDSKPLFLDGAEYAKHIASTGLNKAYGFGYQEGFNWYRITHSTINLHPNFKWAHEIILSKIKEVIGKDCVCMKSWMNISNGNRDNGNLTWHSHRRFDYAGVYYLKIPFPFFSNGTLFKDHGFIKAKENSMIVFPGHFMHTTPSSPLRFKRHTWALDLNIKKDLVNGSNEGRTV